MKSELSGDDVIAMLGLHPHPEGGHFRETFRDTAEPGTRAASTAIYFLLKAGERSHWHAVDAAEAWHFYAGDPLLLEMSPTGGPIAAIRLGSDPMPMGRGRRRLFPPVIGSKQEHWENGRLSAARSHRRSLSRASR